MEWVQVECVRWVLGKRVCFRKTPVSGAARRGVRACGSSHLDFTAAPSSGSNQVLTDCILNKFCIGSNVKHFHDPILVKSDGASGDV